MFHSIDEPQIVFIHLSRGILIICTVTVLQTKLLWTLVYRLLGGLELSFLWDKFPGVWLKVMCQVHVQYSKKLPKYSPEHLYHLTLPPAMYEKSLSLPAFGIVTIFYFSHNNRCVVISYRGFHFHFLMVNDVGCLFMLLFAIPIASSVKYLFVSFTHFLIGLCEHIFVKSLQIYFENASFFCKHEGNITRLFDYIMDI